MHKNLYFQKTESTLNFSLTETPTAIFSFEYTGDIYTDLKNHFLIKKVEKEKITLKKPEDKKKIKKAGSLKAFLKKK